MDQEQNDEKLEKLLNAMPKQEDDRTKEEILERLKKDERLSVNRIKQMRRKRRVIPLFVAAFALLLAVVLLPPLLDSPDTRKQSADRVTVRSDSESDSNSSPAFESEESGTGRSSKGATAESEFSMKETSRYADFSTDLEGGRIWNIGLQDAQAVSIPVSIRITKEQLEAEGLTGSATDLELYEAFADELDEQALGFEELNPIDASFTEKEDVLSIMLKETHKYDMSAATQEIFFHSLAQSFPSYREIRILDAAGDPIQFDQAGTVEPILKLGNEAHTPYYAYTQENGRVLLAPDFMQSADSFEEVLRLMQGSPNDYFKAVIPVDLRFTVKIANGIAEVTFNDRVQLDSMAFEETDRLIDALALTAASFDVQLKLTNISPLEWSGLDFSKPLPIALGSNPMPLILK